jgi:hypothetical protein
MWLAVQLAVQLVVYRLLRDEWRSNRRVSSLGGFAKGSICGSARRFSWIFHDAGRRFTAGVQGPRACSFVPQYHFSRQARPRAFGVLRAGASIT